VREYIDKNITGGKAPILKLININDTSYNINEKIYDGLLIRRKQYEADQRFRQEIGTTLGNQEEKTGRQIDILVENLLATYDKITNKKKEDLSKGISFGSMVKRSFNSMLGFEKSPKAWLDDLAKDFEYQLNSSLKDKLNTGVIDIAESIQHMGKLVDVRIKDSETILKDNHEIFSDIAEKRTNVLRDLQKTFSTFLSNSESFYDEEVLAGDADLTPKLAAGGGIAIVGAIITAVTNGAVFDITGGILTAVGLAFAGVTVGLKRRKILNGFTQEISKGRTKLETEVSDKLKGYASRIKQRIEDNFFEFDKHLDQEKQATEHLDALYQDIKMNLKDNRSALDKELGGLA